MFWGMYLSFILLITVVQLKGCSSTPLGVVKSFFKFKNVGAINAFPCSKEDGIKMMLKFNTGVYLPLMTVTAEPARNFNFMKHFRSQKHQLGTFIDLSCEANSLIFQEASIELLLNMSNVFLLFANSQDEIFKHLLNSNIAFDSDIAVMYGGQIFDVYRIDNNKPIIMNEIGSWNVSTGESIHFKSPPIRDNLLGASIKGIIVITKLPINETIIEKQLLDHSYYPQLDLLTRNAYSIHRHIELLYNFSHSLIPTKDWGYMDKDGHFGRGSMFGAMEEETADLCLTLLRMISDRENVALFLPPTVTYRSCFIFKHPSTLASYFAFAKPFSLSSWICILAALIIAGVCLRLIRHYLVDDVPDNDPSLSASLLIILGIFSQQGIYNDSLRIPTRILTLFLEVTSVLVYAFYGAEVVGFLLTPSPKTINTVDKLIESPLQTYSENLPYYINHFTGNVSEKATRAYEKGIKGPTRDQDKFINLDKGVEEMRRGKMALFAQDINMYTVIDKTFTNSEKCSLFEIEIIKLLTTTAVRKKSPFKELLSRGLLRIWENGLRVREIKIWHSGKPACFGKEGRGTSVPLEATVMAQALYGTGVLLAIAVFIIERKRIRFKKINKAQETAIDLTVNSTFTFNN